jgi:hypothetical protein
MLLILLTLLLLCALPVLLVVLFRETLAVRKQEAILDDLKKLKAFDVALVQSKGGEAGIKQNISNVFSRRFLFPPAILLSLLYLPGFLLCHAFVNLKLGAQSGWLFPASLVEHIRPVVFAFMGVYLFNLGSIVRRLYLSDLSEHVFWGGINRLLLSIGAAIVLATFRVPASSSSSSAMLSGIATDVAQSDSMFFAIGFLANAFLQGVLSLGLRAGKLSRAKTDDLPLQLVRGINIWKEYRLEEEGIEDVQNLATADVIDLAVKTHYGIRTLIDWVDQSILVVRLGKDKTQKLWDIAGPVSAIDLAWQSPENSGTCLSANTLAAKLDMEPLVMCNLMNSLLEDAYVRTLWTLWQTRAEGKDYPTLSEHREPLTESRMGQSAGQD